MPRKRRHDKRSLVVTPDVACAALTIAAWRHHWGSDDAAREAWERLKDSPKWLKANPGFRPAPFWFYTPGVPVELRVEPERLDPRPILSPRVTDEYSAALDADGKAHDQLKAARIRWLDKHGLLGRDERRKLGLHHGDPDVTE